MYVGNISKNVSLLHAGAKMVGQELDEQNQLIDRIGIKVSDAASWCLVTESMTDEDVAERCRRRPYHDEQDQTCAGCAREEVKVNAQQSLMLVYQSFQVIYTFIQSLDRQSLLMEVVVTLRSHSRP